MKNDSSYNLLDQRSEIVEISRPTAAWWLKQIGIASVYVAFFSWALGGESPAFAQGPENVLVVVNADSADSLTIANHYIQLRDIPAKNVLYLNGIAESSESSNSSKFKKQILDPILKTLGSRGLENQITCVAYSAGFPTRVTFQPELRKYLEQTGRKYQITLHAPYASLSSLTYFHQNAFSDSPDFLQLDANHYANPQQMKVLANPFTGKDASQFDFAMVEIKATLYDSAIEKLMQLGRAHPEQISVIYSLARCHALKDENDKAFTFLQHAKNLGFASKSLLESNAAFSELRNLPEFKSLTNDMEDLPDGTSPTRSFSGGKYWAKNGWPNGNSEQGERYLLSSLLAVTGENRSSLQASLDRLTSSARADGTAPQGNVYFAKHKDVRARTRQTQFPAAVNELKSLGRSASIGSDVYPINDSQVIGATLGSAAPKWSESNSQFLPGAICDNLTSYGAAWSKPGQTQINEWLDAGAAGASGTVYEPYAIAAKFPSSRWHAHYAKGCTLAESFYRSVSGPFQLLLVGDPLCCPFGKFPKFEISGFENGATVTEDFRLVINQSSESAPVKRYEVFYDGAFLTKATDPNSIPVAITQMPDGYHEIRVVGVADSPIATRRSKKVSFFVNRKSHVVTLDIENGGDVSGKSVQGMAASSIGNKVQILQNSRTIATVETERRFSIPTAMLGTGKTKLQAIANADDGTVVKSRPIPVSLVGFPNPQQQGETSETGSSQQKPPSSAELKNAVASIRDLLKDQYKDGSPEGRKSLLQLLQKTANETTDDPVNRFALLSECVLAASVFGDVEAGWSACNQIESDYEVSNLPHIEFIKRIKSQLSPESATNLYGKGVGLVEKRIEEDRYEEAIELTQMLSKSLRRLPGVKSEITSLTARIKLLSKKYAEVKTDLELLDKNPSDKDANGKVGMFYCLQKNNYDRGIPYLSQGPSGPVQQLAKNEISIKKPTSEQRLKMADRWWDLAEKEDLGGFRERALWHYQEIVIDLEGLNKLKVEQRIDESAQKGARQNNIISSLTLSAWRIEWTDGRVWEEVKIKKDRLHLLSSSGVSYEFEYREIPNGIETWNQNKVVVYRILMASNRLTCAKFDSRSNQTFKGAGLRMGSQQVK